MKKYWPWLLSAGILALLLATQWNWFSMPFERDEGEYSYAAWILNNGGVPYRDAFMQKPPMIIYTYWLAQRLSDAACWPPRVLAFLFVALTAGVTAWVARREYGARCGWIAAWLFAPMMAFPFLSPVAANTEKFMNLPLMAVVALHLYGRENARPWLWLAAGASAACAVLYKPICLPLLAFVFAVWAVETARQADGWRRVLRFALCAGCGGAAVAGAALLFFIRQGALGALWESVVVYNAAYSAMSGWGSSAFMWQVGHFLKWWWPLIAAAVCFAVVRPPRAWYWITLFGLALAVAYKDVNCHYYIMLVPFWAVMAAWGITRAPARVQRGLAVAAVGLLLLPLIPYLRLSPTALVHRFYGQTPFAESPLAARALADITDPDDRVYVAGSEPQILFYARRRSLTRFVISYPLMLPTPYVRPYQEEVARALLDRPPKAIVLSTNPGSWMMHPDQSPSFMEFLRRLLNERYRPVGHFVQVEGGAGRWQSPYRDQDADRESLVLFLRKDTNR